MAATCGVAPPPPKKRARPPPLPPKKKRDRMGTGLQTIRLQDRQRLEHKSDLVWALAKYVCPDRRPADLGWMVEAAILATLPAFAAVATATLAAAPDDQWLCALLVQMARYAEGGETGPIASDADWEAWFATMDASAAHGAPCVDVALAAGVAPLPSIPMHT